MRILGEETERKICALETARGWKRSGLVSDEQLKAAEAELGPLPAQAGWAVRLLLFGFALSARGAFNAFFTWNVFDHRDWMEPKPAMAPYFFLTAPAFYLLGEWVIRRYRLYRFGAEEGLLIGALTQLWIGLTILFEPRFWQWKDFGLMVSMPTALACALLYLRAGYAYALFAAVGFFTTGVLSQLPDWPHDTIRIISAALFAAMLAASFQRRDTGDHDRFGWQALQAILMLMICFVLNVRLERLYDLDHVEPPGTSIFYWSSFAAVVLLPCAALGWAARKRHRAMLDAAGIAALVAIVSVKPYIGLARHSWDPAVLGVALMGLSLWLKRRLDAGPEGQREGWTAKPVIIPRGDGPEFASLIAAAAAVSASSGMPAQQQKGFSGGGGSSGGAGAQGSF